MKSTIYTVAGKTFELQHYGVKGMKWGVRRYQNEDGSLTAEGKLRLAKSIQDAGWRNNWDERKRLYDDVYSDLSTNYKGRMKKHIANIRAKKKIMDDIGEYSDSDAMKKDSETAYQRTLAWYKKHDKAYLDEIVKANGGKTTDLDNFHGFRKLNDYYTEIEWTKGERKFYKDRGYTKADANRAYASYVKACLAAANDVVGEYGTMEVSRGYAKEYDLTVGRLIASSLMYKDLKEFD